MITLVLLPGLDGTGTLFQPLLAALGNEFKVESVSYPGGNPLTYAELQSLVAATLPNEGSLVLLGESFSGPIAVSLAATHRSRVKGVILCCSFVRNPRPVFSPFTGLLGFVPMGAVPLRLLAAMLFGRFSTAALRLSLQRAVASVSPAVFRARLKAVLTVDASAQLKSISTPALYLQASQDHVVPRSAYAHISRVHPSVRLVSFDSPHCLLQVLPDEAAKVITAFVREIENAL